MAVSRIEEYKQQNGVDILKVYCKATKCFPEGQNYFYCPAEAIGLVQERSWYLNKVGNGVMIMAYKGNTNTLFHQELCRFYHGCYVDYIDHINMVEIDNTNDNLNVVTSQQNLLNRFTRGYRVLNYKHSKLAFRPTITLNGRAYRTFSQTYKEDEVCIQQHYAEQIILKELMGDEFYQFDFLKYRRNSKDILDLERTGKISTEEATYKHILGYSQNAWYYLRYGLQDYFRENHIPVPEYDLDEQGFMIDKITRKKLCPFYKEVNNVQNKTNLQV